MPGSSGASAIQHVHPDVRVELHRIAATEDVVGGHQELRHLDDPHERHVEDVPGDGREQQHTHDDEREVHDEVAEDAIHRIDVADVSLDDSGHRHCARGHPSGSSAGTRLQGHFPDPRCHGRGRTSLPASRRRLRPDLSIRRTGLFHQGVVVPEIWTTFAARGLVAAIRPRIRAPLPPRSSTSAAGIVVSFIFGPFTRRSASPAQYQCWR